MTKLIVFDFNRTLYEPDQDRLISGARELLDYALSQGYRLVLLAKAVDSRGQLLDELGIADAFVEIHLVKTKSVVLLNDLSSRYAAALSRSYLIGDRAQSEIALGHEAGWHTIWYRNGRFADELPRPDRQPDHTVTALAQIRPFI
jgi:FMN phosphatase YigB (HAD superfamily)